jgi:hypothetical protein
MSIFPPALPDAISHRHPSDRVGELSPFEAPNPFRIFWSGRAVRPTPSQALFTLQVGGVQ